MQEFKVTEIEDAVQVSLAEAAKEFGQVTKENREDILKRGYEIVDTYTFVVGEEVSYDPTTGEKITKTKTSKWSKLVSPTQILASWRTYKRLADFSKLPIKNPFFHKADKNKFVETCKELFPNVDAYNVGACLTTFRQVIENIYYNLGFEGLKPQQRCFYQFSALGGTGKSEFLNRLKTFLDSVDLPNNEVHPIGRWIGSEFSSSIVGYVNEFFPIRGSDSDNAIVNLNNIIDNTDYKVEYKGQDSYFNHSRITLFVNSNKTPFDTNARRYGIVRYNEIPYSSISKEDREKYFQEKDWNKLFMTAFETCPFGEVFEDIECKNSDSLNDLIFAARDYIANAPDTFLIGIQDMTIRQFVSNYYAFKNDFGKVDTKFVKQEIWKFTESLRKAVATGVVKPSTRINGNMAYSRYNWQEIADLPTSEDDIDNSLNDIDNSFERTQQAFNNFMDTVDPTPDPTPTPDPKETISYKDKLSDGWLFDDYFVTADGEKGFLKPEYENKMQRQVVINKPLEMKQNPTRKNEDVEQCNFLFEIDLPKYKDSIESLYMAEDEYYKKGIKEYGTKYVTPFVKEFYKNIVWVCFSGRQSMHIVLRTNNTDPKAREYIFNSINNKYFDGMCDKACKNAARLARNPNAIRENGKKQKALMIQEDAEPLNVDQLVHEFEQQRQLEAMQLKMKLEHLKTFEDEKTPISEQFKRIANKSNSPAIKLAYDIYSTGSVASGANMIGAINAVRLLGPKFIDIADTIQNICHQQHPSNITKSVN